MKVDKEFFDRLKKEEQEARENRIKSMEHHWEQKTENFIKTGSYY